MKVLHLLLPLLAASTLAAPPDEVLPQYRDVTAGSGIDFVHTFGDADMSNLVESSGVGVCLFDADGDGLLDVYFVNGAALPGITDAAAETAGPKPTNHLYKNLGGFKFKDVTATAGVGDEGFGMGCVAGDLDNDGDADLVVTNYGPNRVYRNEGVGDAGEVRFTEVASELGLDDSSWSLGAALFDYDQDGLLDLFVGNYVVFDPDYKGYYVADRFPGPLSFPGVEDRLYRNLGGFRFEDATRKSGIAGHAGRAMGVAAADFNNDGLADVFVANDAMSNYLYKNQGDGTFAEVALEVGLAFGESGNATAAMGADFADYDGDGLLDLVVPDMTFNAVYRASTGELYADVSRLAGVASVAAQFVSWSGHFLDYDNDGLLDLYFATGDLHYMEAQEDLLLKNVGGGRFHDVSLESGEPFSHPTLGRGAAVGDLDNDGDLDVVSNVLAAPPVVLENVGPPSRHWLLVRTVGRRSNRDGVGARVSVETPAGTQVREVRSGAGYLSSSDPRVHFGLGDAKTAKLVVKWPSGVVQDLGEVAADQVLTVEEQLTVEEKP